MCNVCNNNRVKRLEFPLAGLIKYTLLLISTGFKLGIRLFGLVPNFVILYFFLSIQIKEEFRRITTVSLEQSFMYKLDHYTTKRIALMMAKGGVIGTKLRPFMDRLSRVGLFKIVMQGESLSYSFFCLTHTLTLTEQIIFTKNV